MTVQNIERRAGPYVGDGVVSSFSFGFKVFTTGDVLVNRSVSGDENSEEEALELGTDYSVTLNLDQDATPGGTVTLTAPLAAGLRLAILSAIVPDQQTELTNHDGFWPETLNEVHDKAIALIQELKEETSRTLKVPSTSEKTPEELTQELLEAQTEAKQYAENAAASAAEASQAAEDAQVVVGLTPEIKAVADNITHVVTDSQNIEAIKAAAEVKTAIQTVAADFTDEVASPNIHDFGVWGVDSIPSVRPTGGKIAAVADGMTDIAANADNMEDIKTVAEKLPQAESVLAQIEEHGTAAEAAQVAAEAARDKAKAWATGTGIVEEELYSAKHYAETAISSASSAKASETASAGSASAAKASETAAAKSASDANADRVAANAARENAQEAQAKAEAAQTATETAQDAAEEAAETALSAANTASQSVTTARNYASTATQAATSAAGSASAADASANAASTSATNAKASENAAAASATAADQSKTAAAGSASAAAQSASAAQTAQTAAEKAAQEAQEAAVSVGDPIGREEVERDYLKKTDAQTNYAEKTHNHTSAQISDLATILASYQKTDDADAKYATQTALTQGLNGKADATHGHAITQVGGLQEALDGKASATHTHTKEDVEGLDTALAGKSDTGHKHTIADIQDLSFDFGKWEAA